ncbi:MAG TPA: Rid family detoxifying hydrolase [Fervidobacterium sp.]|nr:reactive intermediate/imine deaminase [Fervidobacterium sp.]HOQ39407.1 Rid family detoxifying hydrolase [Fervidobacterium sp.]HPT53354.1 Rid family detoxifying hydrolase [Fervidobacterium sp.]HPZ16906.1 Rid family detoxifying hydrolase [Fervidobacterium sp.]HQE47903.1 Rid family detoxifying hydrolase [Fervidobacterium sp.]
MEVLRFEKGPKAVGPYSSAVKSGNLIFFSGILPIIPETGEIITDDVSKAVEQILRNLSAMLSEIGLSLSNVVKSTIFTTQLDEFPRINETYGRVFKDYVDEYPARSAVGVKALPKGATVEMEFVIEA